MNKTLVKVYTSTICSLDVTRNATMMSCIQFLYILDVAQYAFASTEL